MNPPALLRDLFHAVVESVSAARTLPQHLPPEPCGRTVVVGAGKAAAAMASVIETHWSGPLSGLVITRYAHGAPCQKIEVVEAAHPVPDAKGLEAAQRLLHTVEGLTPNDLVICVISGGGSALMPVPGPGLALKDKQSINRALLASGANITQMNCVRKHLSAIKGECLAIAASPAPVVTLMISDVPGDDPSTIASGPTVAGATTLQDAREVLEKYAISLPEHVQNYLQNNANETPKPGARKLLRSTTVMLATAQDALEAAAQTAREGGLTPIILGDSIEGEAREVALVHAGIARQVVRHGQPAAAPCVLLSGGETTVTIRGSGRGGRNAEFLAALAIALDGAPNIHAIACDTDGIDGTEDNAGCIMGPDTLARAGALGLDPKSYLANNDGYGLFSQLGDIILTGPTLTNVNDFRAILIT